MREGIHPVGGPKRLTAVQEATANRLVEQGVYVYTEKVAGKGIVDAFRRYLTTGDSTKITNAL